MTGLRYAYSINPAAKLFTIVGVVGSACLVCALVVTVTSVREVWAGVGNNLGDLAGAAVTTPILVVVYVIGAALASTVASGAIVFLGNELGSFDPWPRSRVRLWSAATVVSASLVGLFLAVKLFG